MLAVARVSNFADAARFMGLPDRGEPPSTEPGALAAFVRQTFYPSVAPPSDLSFVTEQGILPPAGSLPAEELLFRLIDKKGAFEWQQGVLVSWDGQQDAADGERPAEGVRARARRAHLPAHRRRAPGDERGIVDRRRADRLPRRGEHDPDARLPDQFRESRGRSLFAAGRLAGAQDDGGAGRRVPGRWRSASSPTCA